MRPKSPTYSLEFLLQISELLFLCSQADEAQLDAVIESAKQIINQE